MTLSCLCSLFENNYFSDMCSGSEAGSYLRLIDFVYHWTLGLRVLKKKRKKKKRPRGTVGPGYPGSRDHFPVHTETMARFRFKCAPCKSERLPPLALSAKTMVQDLGFGVQG